MLDLGKTEAQLPKKEQSRLESYSVGDRVRCVIKLVDKSSKGPGRGGFARRARAGDAPVRTGSARDLRRHGGRSSGCAREAGERTKIAVQSRDRDVDSVGACVGMKGMRVQSIIRELRGEKIDIIEFSDDSGGLRHACAEPGQDQPHHDHRSARKAHGSDRRRFAALARHRQEGAERAPGGQAAGLEDRYQERRREAAGSGVADGRAGCAGRAGFGADRLRPAGKHRRRRWSKPASAPSRSWAA